MVERQFYVFYVNESLKLIIALEISKLAFRIYVMPAFVKSKIHLKLFGILLWTIACKRTKGSNCRQEKSALMICGGLCSN